MMDLPNLDGNWQALRAEMAGTPFPEAVTKTIQLKIENGRYEMQHDTGIVEYLEKDRMSITGTGGPNDEKTFKAIYKQEGDELTICYDLSGSSFPSSFATEAKTQLFLVNYTKTK